MEIKKESWIIIFIIVVVDIIAWLILVYYGIKIDVKILAVGILTTGIMSGYNMFKIFNFWKKEEKRKKIEKVICGFDSREMRRSMMRLGDFKRENPSSFLRKFEDELRMKLLDAKTLSLDSGDYFHHFRNNVFGRFEKIDDAFIKSVVYISQVKLLLGVVDPMEEIKAKVYDMEYDKNVAKECRRIFKDELER